ncbi:hypothetical protein [Botryobacter ruber]|uniref:hypothetical protein n=1 Tax=Botryobacter ruber TaxID=2171629 RepID=UPI000FEC48C6|nr:hypothetical protein [Botryobacter ruber]
MNKENSWSYNIAYKHNISNDPKYAEKYLDFENNPYALGVGDTVVDCIVNTSFRQFSREYGGLTITSYLREKIEAKLPGDSLQPSDIYKKLDLTVGELEQLDYKVIIK